MNIKQLIQILGTKYQPTEVEFIVIDTEGRIVTMDVGRSAPDLIDVLKFFRKGEQK